MIARVVPAVPTFSVDEGFRYAVPDRLAGRVAVGSLVRVPLGGRRVAGFVVATEPGPAEGLKAIAAVSGAATVFDPGHLELLRWVARHYVAPLSVALARSAPPSVPPGPPAPPSGGRANPFPHPLLPLEPGVTIWLDAGPAAGWIRPVVAALGGRSLLVVLPTGEEVQAVAADLGALGGCLITVDHDMDDAAVTAAWARARHWGGVLVGTPRVSAWPVAELGAVAAVEESRRAMKDRQTPTLHVREILLRRAAAGNLPAVFAGPAPSLELMAGKPRIRRAGGRLWALVEVVDRREDPPGSGLVSERARQAIRVAVARGERVFVFAHRHGYSAASRCVRCRTLRRCPTCGSRPDPQPACRRCGQPLGPCAECGGARFEPLGAGVGRLVEEVGRVVDSRNVAEHPAGTAVTVGTERDLTTLPLQDLVVFVDIDGLVFGVDYRAAEEAFRIGTRLAGRVRHGSGRRLLVQTNDPDHPAVVALRRAEPARFHVPELAVRRSMTYPPYGALLVLEARGSEAGEADAAIRDAAGELTVLGPAPTRTGARWLVHGRDLTAFKDALRPVLQRLRDSGLTMRVDVDPIDL